MSEQKSECRSPVKEMWKKLGNFLSLLVDRLEVTLISASTAALAILLITNVFARTFYRSIYFAEEISQFLVIMVTFVGTSYAARKARHIRMGAILEALPPKIEKVLVMLMALVSAFVMFYLAYYSFEYMSEVRFRGQTTPSLRAPYWTFLIIVPIGFFMAGFQYVRTFIKNVVEKDVWLSPEQQSEYEDEQVMLDEVREEVLFDEEEIEFDENSEKNSDKKKDASREDK